jgi:hypothetical protein
MALAQFPVVFLFATKNSLLSLLLGPGNGYERLNYIHRWSGRGMFLAAVIHGSLWVRNHLEWNMAILGQQKEGSGVAALGLLSVIVLTSLQPVRKYFYQAFFTTQCVVPKNYAGNEATNVIMIIAFCLLLLFLLQSAITQSMHLRGYSLPSLCMASICLCECYAIVSKMRP